MERFDVSLAREYWPVQRDYKIYLTPETVIKKTDEDELDIPRQKFNFSELDTIPAKVRSKTHLTDVICMLERIGNITKRIGMNLREIVIVNKRNILRMEVTDSSGVTLFVAFDRQAECLIQTPVKDLLAMYSKQGQ